MPALETLFVFAAASVTMLLIPGPAVAFIVATSIAHGRLAGVASALGLVAGGLLHLLAAILGLGAVLAAWPGALRMVTYAGAAYLLWLGIGMLRRPPASAVAPAAPTRSLRRLFLDGLVVNAANPKAAFFFLAFLPQFVDPARGPAVPQALLLGAAFLSIAIVTDSTYAIAAGSLGRRLRERPGLAIWGRRAAGGVYIGLALLAVLAGGSV